MEKTFPITTSKREDFVDITSQVADIVTGSGVENGICIVYTPHTTSAITINEGADPAVKTDVLLRLRDLAEDDRYMHSEGNSDSHVKSSLVGCSETVIINGGDLVLGTWQSIYFCEFDGPRTRKVVVKVLEG